MSDECWLPGRLRLLLSDISASSPKGEINIKMAVLRLKVIDGKSGERIDVMAASSDDKLCGGGNNSVLFQSSQVWNAIDFRRQVLKFCVSLVRQWPGSSLSSLLLGTFLCTKRQLVY